ncbi:hypothetical protein LCGC14_1602670, partial [marine sediment metagenome]
QYGGVTDKLNIIYQIKSRGTWYESVYSTSAILEQQVKQFDISQFLLTQQAPYFEDFRVIFVIIGDNTNLTVNSIKLRNEVEISEYYRITDLLSGSVSDWTKFDSTTITKLNQLGDLPGKFILEYKVIEPSGNEVILSTYNSPPGYNYIKYSTETPLSFNDDIIDLNSIVIGDRTLSFEADFGGVASLNAYINGFLYGTQAINTGGNNYELTFGDTNNYDSLLGYSDSLVSPTIYSNINPLNQISWEIPSSNYFGVVKHVLIDNDVSIINPLTYNASVEMDFANLYNRGLILPKFARIKEVYYYNSTNLNKTSLSFGEYVVNNSGYISWPTESKIHNYYANRFNEIKDGKIFFDYYASDFSTQLGLSNADGFKIDFIMPSVYWDHTTIEKLIISFNDFLGNAFTKTFFDLDLRKYFMDSVKSNYEQVIFGMGKVMVIPLYIPMKDLLLSNPYNIFELHLLDSISFTISDSPIWPGSFIHDYEVEGYSVLNLPYQRVGIQDIKLYNLISDSAEEQGGFVRSEITLRAPDYYDFYATSEFNVKRIDTELTDIKVFYNGQEITAPTDIQYSDSIEVYLKQGAILDPILFDELLDIQITLFDTINTEAISISNLNWITKDNRISPNGYTSKYYYAKFQVPQLTKLYNGLTIASYGTPIHNIIIGEKDIWKESSWYKLDGNALDSSGNNDGTEVGTITYTNGIIEESMSVSGQANNHIDTLTSSFTTQTSFSIACWLKIPSSYTWNTLSYNPIVAAGQYAGGHGLVRDRISDNSVSMYIRTSTTTQVARATITRDVWAYIVGVFDANSEQLRIYKDGILIDTASTSSFPVEALDADHFDLGGGTTLGGNSDPNRYFEGSLDEVRIFDHALSQEEVSWLYNIPNQPLYTFDFALNVIQESLSGTEAIYLSEENFELEYSDALILEGVLLDDDIYLVEDEIYKYNYQNALDGKTVYSLDILAPMGEDSFIDKTQFSIFYLDNQLEKLPLYINQYRGSDLIHTKDNALLDQKKDPEIAYFNNTYYLTVYWNPNAANLMTYDTELLITYKVIKGRPISPSSYSTFDSYGHNNKEHLVEIPFARYDMINNGWITEEDFNEVFPIDKELIILDAYSTSIPTNIYG